MRVKNKEVLYIGGKVV